MKRLIILFTFLSLVFMINASGYDIEGIYGYGNFSNINMDTYNNSMVLNSASLMKRKTGFNISFSADIYSINEKRTVKLFDSYDNYLADYPIYESTHPYYDVQNVEIGYTQKYFGAGLFYTPFSDNNYNYDYIEHDDYYVKTGEVRRYSLDNTNRLGFVLGIRPLRWLSVTGSYQNIQGYINDKYQHLTVDPTVDDTTIIDRNTYSGNMWNAGLHLIPNYFVDISLFGEFPANIRIEDDNSNSIDTFVTTHVNIVKYPYVLGGELKFRLPNRLPATLIIDGNYTLWHNLQITDHTLGDSVYYDSSLNNSLYLKMVVKHELSANQCISFGASIQQSYLVEDLIVPSYIFGYTYKTNTGFKLSGVINYSTYSVSNSELNINMPFSTSMSFNNFYFRIKASKCFGF